MNAEQERIAAELSKRSMGAPFLLRPDAYRNGKTLIEPCDLVWACNGCVILISMIEGGRSREKMSRHNFNQMKGFYQEWYQGRSIKGRNAYSRFAIPFDQYPHKVLISVVKGTDALSELNPGIGDELASLGLSPPTLCATITQNVLEYIACHGGSVIDLLEFLESLHTPLSADAGLRAIRRIHNRCFNSLPFEGVSGAYRNDLEQFTLDPVYSTLRSGGNYPNPSNGLTDSLMPLLLSDLNWSQIVKIVHQTKYLESKAGKLAPGVFGIQAASTVLDFSPYLLGLLVNKFSGPGSYDRTGEHAGLLQREIWNHKSYRERFSLIISYNIGEGDYRSVFARVIPPDDDSAPTLRSQTTALLDKIQTQQFGQS